MTYKERTAVVERMLVRYESLGALVVADDQTLCRLLISFRIDAEDRDLGDHLASFLIA